MRPGNFSASSETMKARTMEMATPAAVPKIRLASSARGGPKKGMRTSSGTAIAANSTAGTPIPRVRAAIRDAIL